jgi:hypothetical protein
MFEGIKKSIFDDPEFKEDSVRELIIAPMLSKLGYLPSGSHRIARSKTLKNPFIRVGTRNHPVTTIPDYTFYIEDRPAFVLDAKGPSEGVLDNNHIQQAYSYAIHPEIRCDEFGLCNGKELAIFSTSKIEPLLHVDFEKFESKWDEIEKYLSPKYLSDPVLRKFAPDFGMALLRMGFTKETEMHMLETRLNLFAKIDDSLMTASANCNFGSGDFCASFDFHPEMLSSIVSGLPKQLADRFTDALKRTPFQAAAGLSIELDITVNLGEVTQGQSEEFVPLIIKEIHDSRFNPAEIPNDPNDIPPYIFKLRDHFVLKSGTGNA